MVCISSKQAYPKRDMSTPGLGVPAGNREKMGLARLILSILVFTMTYLTLSDIWTPSPVITCQGLTVESEGHYEGLRTHSECVLIIIRLYNILDF